MPPPVNEPGLPQIAAPANRVSPFILFLSNVHHNNDVYNRVNVTAQRASVYEQKGGLPDNNERIPGYIPLPGPAITSTGIRPIEDMRSETREDSQRVLPP